MTAVKSCYNCDNSHNGNLTMTCQHCVNKSHWTPRKLYLQQAFIQTFPQAKEENEYRYFSPDWLNAIAKGLTAGAEKHPGETWRKIPANEHAWRAVRHLVMYLAGDREDSHIVNASMRCMMAFETEECK